MVFDEEALEWVGGHGEVSFAGAGDEVGVIPGEGFLDEKEDAIVLRDGGRGPGGAWSSQGGCEAFELGGDGTGVGAIGSPLDDEGVFLAVGAGLDDAGAGEGGAGAEGGGGVAVGPFFASDPAPAIACAGAAADPDALEITGHAAGDDAEIGLGAGGGEVASVFLGEVRGGGPGHGSFDDEEGVGGAIDGAFRVGVAATAGESGFQFGELFERVFFEGFGRGGPARVAGASVGEGFGAVVGFLFEAEAFFGRAAFFFGDGVAEIGGGFVFEFLGVAFFFEAVLFLLILAPGEDDDGDEDRDDH